MVLGTLFPQTPEQAFYEPASEMFFSEGMAIATALVSVTVVVALIKALMK